jgi:beta-phosphoglucomutase
MSKGVIFDMDGVLVASESAHQASWQALARKHGLELTDDAFVDSFGRTSRDIIQTLWGDGVADDDIERYDREKEAIYRELVTGMVPLAIGAREVLTALRDAGWVLAVATSGPPENLELVLDETNLRPMFAATVHGFDVERGKPAPDVFLLAAERSGLGPQACVVVEDAPAGIAAALAADMRVIGLVGTHAADRLRAAGATHVAQHLRDVTPKLVMSLLE